MGSNLSRPDWMFAIVWAITTDLARRDLYYMGFDQSRPITLLIGLNIISFFLIYQLTRRTLFSGSADRETHLDETASARLQRINSWLFVLWCALFVYIVARSGGLPLFWRVQHLAKSYVEFGVPTLSGFANMIRSMVFCLSVLLVLRYKSRTAGIIGTALFASSLLEMARANTIYLLLCGLAVFLVRHQVRARTSLALAFAGAVFVLAFGWTEHYRSPGGSGGEAILQYPSVLNRLPYGVTSVYLYLSTPVSNLYYAEAHGITPLRLPYYSTQLIVPTIVRDKLYKAHTYPIALRRDSYNATTFYSPFVADFGVLAAGLLVCLIQFAVSYVHIRGSRGDVFYQLIYGPLYAALVLSFFFNYFLTLGVLLFPLVVLFLRSRVAGQAGPRHQVHS